MDILVWIHIAGLFATGVWLIAVYGKNFLADRWRCGLHLL